MAYENLDKYDIHILRKLHRQKNIGMNYMPVAKLTQGLPSHERDKTVLNKSIKKLTNMGLVELYKGGRCIYLVASKIREIENILDRYH